MNEFNKLDQFMRQHAPGKPPVTAAPRLPNSTAPWVPLLASFVLVVFVFIGIKQLTVKTDDEQVLLTEMLEWDENNNDLPIEVTDLVALSE